MNTNLLDLPWYRNGCERTDSFRMASVSSSSSSASSSSLGGSLSIDAGGGGAMENGEEVRVSSAARELLAWGRSDGVPGV